MTTILIVTLIIFGLAMFAESPAAPAAPTTPAAMLADDLSPTPGDKDAAASKPPEQKQPEQKPPDEKTPPVEKKTETGNVNDELAALRKEVEELKKNPQKLEAERRAYDKREDYIRTNCQKFPATLMRKILPVTEDAKLLDAARADFQQDWENTVKMNNIKIPDVGGAARDGGNAPEAQQQQQQLPKNPTPQQMLASDLEPSLPTQSGARRS